MSSIAKSTIILMVITMLSKVLGFGRELVLTYTYGPSMISDSYITALGIPTILFAVVGSAISTSYIPLACEIDKSEGRKEMLCFTNNVSNIVVIIGMMLSILVVILAEPIVKVFAMDFSGEKLKLTVEFTRIMIFGVIFIGLSNIMTGWLNINENFSIPGMIGISFNICIILGIIISTKTNLVVMAIGSLLGMISQFLIQLPFAVKKGYKYKIDLNLNDKNIKKLIFLIMPVIIGVGVNQLNLIIDRSLASTLGDGIITILNSANRLNGFVIGLFISTIAVVIYPTLSELSTLKDKNEFSRCVVKSVNTVVLVIIPISIGAIVLSDPVVRIIFERGAFTQKDTYMTSIALSCYSIGMIGFGLREVLNKVFYALKDTKTPMFNGAISMGINIVLNLVLIKYLGYAGLALATSLSAIICIVLFFNSLKKHLGYFGQDVIIKTAIKSFIASVIMGIVTYLIFSSLSYITNFGVINDIVNLSISVVVGALLYGIIIILLRVEEVNEMLSILKNKVMKS